MKKNKHYEMDSFDFFKSVFKSKRNPKDDKDYKSRLTILTPDIEPEYSVYDIAFSKNSLTTIIAGAYIEQQKDDLLNMYKYSNSKIQKLKNYILTDENDRTSSTCLHCSFGEANTLDHYLPKKKFPQFAVHPKNLIPSCSKCNSKKSENWVDGNEKLFLNSYLDEIPDLPYLFCQITKSTLSFKVNFVINNPYGIDTSIYNVIASHYSRLDLCNRLNEYCSDTIIEFINEYSAYGGDIKSFVKHSTIVLASNEESFGINYWKNVLKSSLISSPIFLSFLTKNYP